MSKRELKQVTWDSQSLSDLPDNHEALTPWLKEQATEHKLNYALVHADDGVIWGAFANGQWVWSSDVFPNVSPKLRWMTLQQMRLFGTHVEVFVWRGSGVLKGRLITDNEDQAAQECFDEEHLLWGYDSRANCDKRDGFCLIREGAQGLLHAPPEAIARAGKLMTRNYIGYDADGCAFVKASRLVANEG